MNNTEKAAQVIGDWLQENYSITHDTGNPSEIAKALADAGLITPDLPERPDDIDTLISLLQAAKAWAKENTK